MVWFQPAQPDCPRYKRSSPMATLSSACVLSVFLLSVFFCITPLVLAKSSSFLRIRTSTELLGHADVAAQDGGREISAPDDAKKVRRAQGMYFSLKHRDAPGSPFRQLYKTRHNFLQIVLQRDEMRVKSFVDHIKQRMPRLATGASAHMAAAEPAGIRRGLESRHLPTLYEFETGPLIPPAGAGEYYTELYVGTPRQLLVAMVDLGSDAVWVGEFLSRKESPRQSYYFPALSSSFTPIPSNSDSCRSIKGIHVHRAGSCRVVTGVEEKYNGAAEFAYEVFRLNGTAKYRAHALSKLLFSVGKVQLPTGGVLGLGQGKTSLASQLGNSYLPPSRNGFSYCLADTDEPSGSSLVFGGHQADADLQFTPFISHPHVDTFYYVNLVCVAVNGVKLSISRKVWKLDPEGEGGTIVDPGTRFSKFSKPVFRLLVTALRAFIKLPTVSVPGFQLCYNISNIGALPFPTISFIFEDDAELKLPVENSFVSGNEQGDAMCLAMVPGDPGAPSVIGGAQQQNFLMVFDRERSLLGFAPRQCASL